MVTIGVHAVDLLEAEEADRLVGPAVNRRLGALPITNETVHRDTRSVDRSLRHPAREAHVDARHCTAAP
jgi:hypothetical protein